MARRHTVVARRRGTRRSGRLVRTSYYVRRGYRHHRYYQTWTAHSYTDADLELGDQAAGEDPVVREAAIDALGRMNGAVVAIDPTDGRILAMVNQQMALSTGGIPCSTIKLSVALSALKEGIVTKDTEVQLGPHYAVNMTQAIAHSNNEYFATLGQRLGFERVHKYAMEFGLGQLAGLNIPGEHPGFYPSQVIPASEGGIGKMTSFGTGILMTPLQLGALVSAIANGGTLYYLQHPTTPEQIDDFQPRVKRQLNIAKLIPEVTSGMEGAVDYGTARSLRVNFKELPVLGKTGTCSLGGTRFGWFGSFADTSRGRIVVVFMLEGGRATFGPRAADLAGVFYRDLWNHDYFQQRTIEASGSEPSAQGTTVGATQ